MNKQNISKRLHNKSHKKILVVLGMHRSGTSAITRALQVFGIGLGENLMQAMDGVNAKGFWEDLDIVNLNIRILRAIQSDWYALSLVTAEQIQQLINGPLFIEACDLMQQKLANTSSLGLKDPRIAKLVPFWQAVFTAVGAQVQYILAIRNPLSIADSLRKRDGFNQDKSFWLWFGHVLESLAHTQSSQRIIIDYDILLDDAAKQCQRIAKAFDLTINDQALTEYQAEFLDQGLRHSQYTLDDLQAVDQSIKQVFYGLYHDLVKASKDEVNLDEWQKRNLNDYYQYINAQQHLFSLIDEQQQTISQCLLDHQQVKADLVQTQAELVDTQALLNVVLESPSWKLTKPLRKIVPFFIRMILFFNKDIRSIKTSGFFDSDYYLNTNSDVMLAGVDPLNHFAKYGWKEGRNPSEQFDTKLYLTNYPDVAAIGLNPLIHYIKYGKGEGKTLHPYRASESKPQITSKIKTFFNLLVYVKNHPHLIGRVIREINIYGIKKTIHKIKDKSYKVTRTVHAVHHMHLCKIIAEFFLEKPKVPIFTTDKPIDIVIPVYNGKDFLRPLFESIFVNTSMPYRLLVADDKSSDPDVLPLLHEIKEAHPNVEFVLLENETNIGFIRTVNRLVTLAQNHFVLLNTDTEVPPFWIERIMYPIFNIPNIASTTPFTNAGTICSFPNYLEDNPIFEGMSVEAIDKLFHYVNFEKTNIEIPTGVGFCMGVNKELVDKIGMFDEIFGKGYGEENDWCQRAIEAGYKNIHVTNLFVFHKHGGSFKNEEKRKLIQNNIFLLKRKHPTYDEQVQKLIVRNELKTLRSLMVFFLVCSQRHCTLIFDHNLGGGANYYLDESIKKRLSEGEVICLVRYDFNTTKKYIITLMFENKTIDLLAENLDEMNILFQLISVDEVFLNSLVSYPNVFHVIDMVTSFKERFNARVVAPVHDFFALCPNYTLLDENMRYCDVPADFRRCDICMQKNKGDFKIYYNEFDIRSWRKCWNKLLEIADEVLCFSNSSKEIFLKAYPFHSELIKVSPHDISGRYPKIYRHNSENGQIRIGVLGGISEAKGALVLKDLVDHIEKNRLNAKVILIGQISIPLESPCFEVTGRYDKAKLPSIVEEKNITKFIVPSICPETFSYTTDEIMQMGYPLIVFDLGAPAERVKNYDKGSVIKQDQLYETIFK